MNLRNSRLRQQEEEQSVAHEQSAHEQNLREFRTPEELLRHDSAQNPVPATVAERLQKSVEEENIQPPQSWWRRMFSL